MPHVWMLQIDGPGGAVEPVVCATRDVARSRAATLAEGVSLKWEENEQGISIASVDDTMFTISTAPIHQL